MQDQTINWAALPDSILLDVTPPLLLLAESSSGKPVIFEITEGSEYAEIVDGVELRSLAVAPNGDSVSITIRASSESSSQFNAVSIEQSLTIEDSSYDQRLQAILDARRTVDNDKQQLYKLAATPLNETSSIDIDVNPEGAKITINDDAENAADLDNKNNAVLFLHGAPQFLAGRIARNQEMLDRMQQNLIDKTPDPMTS